MTVQFVQYNIIQSTQHYKRRVYLTYIVSVAFSSDSLEGGVGRIENARQNAI